MTLARIQKEFQQREMRISDIRASDSYSEAHGPNALLIGVYLLRRCLIVRGKKRSNWKRSKWISVLLIKMKLACNLINIEVLIKSNPSLFSISNNTNAQKSSQFFKKSYFKTIEQLFFKLMKMMRVSGYVKNHYIINVEEDQKELAGEQITDV